MLTRVIWVRNDDGYQHYQILLRKKETALVSVERKIPCDDEWNIFKNFAFLKSNRSSRYRIKMTKEINLQFDMAAITTFKGTLLDNGNLQ